MKKLILLLLVLVGIGVQAQVQKIDSLNYELEKISEEHKLGLCYGLSDSVLIKCMELQNPIDLLESLKWSIVNKNGIIDSTINTEAVQLSLISYKQKLLRIDSSLNLDWISDKVLSNEDFLETPRSSTVMVLAYLTEKQAKLKNINRSVIPILNKN